MFSIEAINYAGQALKAQAKYLEIQSANWLILTEQGQKEAARTIDAEVADMCKPKQWINLREFTMIVISSIRDSHQENVDGVTLRVRTLLERYSNNEKRWMCTSEILAAEATMQLSVYRKWLGLAVVEDARKGTPCMIRRNLLSLNLDVDVEIIDEYLVAMGILIAKPESINIVETAEDAMNRTSRSISPSLPTFTDTEQDQGPSTEEAGTGRVRLYHSQWSKLKALFNG